VDSKDSRGIRRIPEGKNSGSQGSLGEKGIPRIQVEKILDPEGAILDTYEI